MRKNIIIFDVDKTLIRENLHELIIDEWKNKNPLNYIITNLVSAASRIIILSFLRRRLEYFLLALMPHQYIDHFICRVIEDEKFARLHLIDRIRRYRKYNHEVIIVSAAPEKIIAILASRLGVSSCATKMILGIIVKDLLAKKHLIYRTIENDGGVIRTIYSDSEKDFWPTARNVLITNEIFWTLK